MAEQVREHRRFEARHRVEVAVAERSELFEMYTRDISKGGMFVESDAPVETGARVAIVLQTPHGALELEGEVVHVLTAEMAAQYGQVAGVGVQFTSLTDQVREQLNAYVLGLADAPGLSEEKVERAPKMAGSPLQHAHRLLRNADEGDLYAAIDLPPETSQREVDAQLERLAETFASPPSSATPPERARIEAAGRALKRLHNLMRSVERRVEYDFRAGHGLIKERKHGSRRDELPTSELRAIWARLFPMRVEKAESAAVAAAQRFQSGGFKEAFDMGVAAAEDDPFNEELEAAIVSWARIAGQ